MSTWVWIAIAAVGGTGAVGRFLLDAIIGGQLGRDFPFGTLTINLTGAFVLGLLTGLALEGDLLVIAGTATIGSYTTFSTWMLETHRLVEDTEKKRAFLNVIVSLGIGFGAALLGRTIGVHL